MLDTRCFRLRQGYGGQAMLDASDFVPIYYIETTLDKKRKVQSEKRKTIVQNSKVICCCG